MSQLVKIYERQKMRFLSSFNLQRSCKYPLVFPQQNLSHLQSQIFYQNPADGQLVKQEEKEGKRQKKKKLKTQEMCFVTLQNRLKTEGRQWGQRSVKQWC